MMQIGSASVGRGCNVIAEPNTRLAGTEDERHAVVDGRDAGVWLHGDDGEKRLSCWTAARRNARTPGMWKRYWRRTGFPIFSLVTFSVGLDS